MGAGPSLGHSRFMGTRDAPGPDGPASVPLDRRRSARHEGVANPAQHVNFIPHVNKIRVGCIFFSSGEKFPATGWQAKQSNWEILRKILAPRRSPNIAHAPQDARESQGCQARVRSSERGSLIKVPLCRMPATAWPRHAAVESYSSCRVSTFGTNTPETLRRSRPVVTLSARTKEPGHSVGPRHEVQCEIGRG